jgi:hypothetical protein
MALLHIEWHCCNTNCTVLHPTALHITTNGAAALRIAMRTMLHYELHWAAPHCTLCYELHWAAPHSTTNCAAPLQIALRTTLHYEWHCPGNGTALHCTTKGTVLYFFQVPVGCLLVDDLLCLPCVLVVCIPCGPCTTHSVLLHCLRTAMPANCT